MYDTGVPTGMTRSGYERKEGMTQKEILFLIVVTNESERVFGKKDAV
jgi:hypothetical protein